MNGLFNKNKKKNKNKKNKKINNNYIVIKKEPKISFISNKFS